MGINTLTYLPDNVRIRDIMSVIAVAVGLPFTHDRWVSVKGIKAEQANDLDPSYVTINFGGRQAMYFFEQIRKNAEI